MNSYLIHVIQKTEIDVRIECEDQQQAIEMIFDGQGEPSFPAIEIKSIKLLNEERATNA